MTAAASHFVTGFRLYLHHPGWWSNEARGPGVAQGIWLQYLQLPSSQLHLVQSGVFWSALHTSDAMWSAARHPSSKHQSPVRTPQVTQARLSAMNAMAGALKCPYQGAGLELVGAVLGW